MPRWFQLSVPFIFLLVGLWASILIIGATAPAACYDIPRAFGQGMQTDFAGDGWGFYSQCSVTNRATGVTVEEQDINWAGPAAALAGCIGAWFLGAALGGLGDRRRAVVSAGIALLISAAALFTAFV